MGFGLQIVQNVKLYRFTSDSVLLSRFATPKKNDVIADFCAGSGIVAFHFHALHQAKALGSSYTLFEMQTALCNLARKTIALNDFEGFAVENCRLQEIDERYREKFSLVFCNPPYERGGFENASYEKAICRKEICITLPEIARAAAKALKFGGRLAMVHRADRLAEICYTLKNVNLEVKKIQFVAGRDGMNPYLVLIEAVKGGKPMTKICPTISNE